MKFLVISSLFFCSLASATLRDSLDVHAQPTIYAIGDIHGSWAAAEETLKLANVIDSTGNWVGENVTVIQTGDLIDRGDEDKIVLDRLAALQNQAVAHKSQLVLLNGNHELMNASWNFSYSSARSSAHFDSIKEDEPGFRESSHNYQARVSNGSLPESGMLDDPDTRGKTLLTTSDFKKRAFAFLPGSSHYAQQLALRPLYVVAGDSVFVHGGLRSSHLPKLIAWQEGLKTWLRLNVMEDPSFFFLHRFHLLDFSRGLWSETPSPGTLMYEVAMDENSPLWIREHGNLPADQPEDSLETYLGRNSSFVTATCSDLEEVLKALQVKRMVIGHTITPTRTISSACNGRVWRIDLGLSDFYRHFGNLPPREILKIEGEKVSVVAAKSRFYDSSVLLAPLPRPAASASDMKSLETRELRKKRPRLSVTFDDMDI